MRHSALLLGALLVPALPLMTAAPAHAAGATICVGAVPTGTVCTTTQPTITAAIGVATTGDTIRPAPNTYSESALVLPNGVSLRGFGAGTGATMTRINQPPGAQTALTVSGGTVADVRVDMTTGVNATGIAASNAATVDNVVVFGQGATGSTGLQAQGSQVHDATVNVTGAGSGNTAIRSLGGNLLYSDSTWNGGAVGYRLVSGTDTVSRITVNLATTAISVEGGTLNLDDSVIDLGGTGTTGVQAAPTGAGAAIVNANHLTVVGGSGASRGVVVDTATAAGTLSATVLLTNSIVRGPTTSLARIAGGDDTTNFTVSRSDYQTSTGAPTDGGNNLLNVDPLFVNSAAADYHLRATSPVVDKGVSSSASLDRDGKARVDGDRDGTATPDMGAYELVDVVAPKTTITGAPPAATKNRTPQFTFKSGDGTAFECRLDSGAFAACTSPFTAPSLGEGAHVFTVRGTDEVGNVEAAPPTVSFKVDSIVPNVKLTKRPANRFYKSRVKFKFTASESGVTFQCQLDGRAWVKCASPYRFVVNPGRHLLLVRATDAAGNVDTTPAKDRFTRVRRKR